MVMLMNHSVQKKVSFNIDSDDDGNDGSDCINVERKYRHNYGKEQQKENEPKSIGKLIKIDGQKIGALLAICACSIVLFKFLVHLTGKPITMLVTDTGIDAFEKMKIASNWLSSEASKYDYLLWTLLCSIGITVFSWIIVYFDSAIPGENPPMPFFSASSSPSPSSKYIRYKNNKPFIHPSYLMAIASGAAVFFLLNFPQNIISQ